MDFVPWTRQPVKGGGVTGRTRAEKQKEENVEGLKRAAANGRKIKEMSVGKVKRKITLMSKQVLHAAKPSLPCPFFPLFQLLLSEAGESASATSFAPFILPCRLEKGPRLPRYLTAIVLPAALI